MAGWGGTAAGGVRPRGLTSSNKRACQSSLTSLALLESVGSQPCSATDEDAQHGEELGISLPKFENLLSQRTLGHPGNVESDDISRWETRPVPSGGAGDTVSKRELDVASVVNETPESVVVTSTSSMSFHASMIEVDVIGASLSPFVRCRSSNESVPQVEPRV